MKNKNIDSNYSDLENYLDDNPDLDDIISTEILFEETSQTIGFFKNEVLNGNVSEKLNSPNTVIIELFMKLSYIHKSMLLTMIYMHDENLFNLFNKKCLEYLSRDLQNEK